MRKNGWKLLITNAAAAIHSRGAELVAERSLAWLSRNRRFGKDYAYRVQTSETMLDIAATRLMLNRLASV